MTIDPDLDVATARGLLGHLQAWESLREARGYWEVSYAGKRWHIVDIEAFYERRWELPTAQRVAIELCLYAGMREQDAAVAMGCSPNSPVRQYCTYGIRRLLGLDIGYRASTPTHTLVGAP